MSRDTQFAAFACRLLQELLDQGAYVAISEWATGGDSAKSEQLIAQRAYDLARHTLEACSKQHRDYGMEPEIDMSTIPDMPTWTEETSE